MTNHANKRQALTPDALEMVATIARTGSFASAARELGKVPSALTYSVRQLEEALDVLLFDRSSRQAQLTPAGEELVREGQRLLGQMDAVAHRVQRIASGWETQLTLVIETILNPAPIYDLIESFYQLNPPTRLKLQHEVLNGTWEALVSGKADVALGLGGAGLQGDSQVRTEKIGEMAFDFVVAPHHPLAKRVAEGHPTPLRNDILIQHRIVAVADSANRLDPATIGILPGQDVLTVSSMSDKLQVIRRGLGCGSVPHYMVQADLDHGRLVAIALDQPSRSAQMHYGWRTSGTPPGKALRWWLEHLQHPSTKQALLGSTR